MKTLLAMVCALLVGVAVGAFLMGAYYAKESYRQSLASIQRVNEKDLGQVKFDLALLEELEAGQPDKAKAFLARIVATYYNAWHYAKLTSPETREVIEHIETSKSRLPALQEALAKKDQ